MQKNSFLKIYGLIPFLLVAFINAFVDLGHNVGGKIKCNHRKIK